MAAVDVRAAVSAWEALFAAQSQLLRRFEREQVWGALSLREYDVLYTLTGFEHGTARLRDLTEATYLAQPSLSRLVDRLATAGLVVKEMVPGDGRGVAVRLTDEGRAVQLDIGRRHARSIAAHVGAALDGAELAELARLCDKLRAG
ncbi:MAG: MarR family transcriptional regulator [Actinobacteria bacterium]|nr:MarR family transcriptional regulator [Actinomycetota bacterium]MCG2803206.1 MarR family transcriptional regulator [Cellulomonas sp.]